MISLFELWLPILLSAVFVFIVSSIIHTVLHIHKGDYRKMSGEEGVLKEMRSHDLKPGAYMFPCPESMKDMCSPEMVEKYNQGPVGFMTVIPPGPLKMGKNLVQWFLYSLLVSIFVAYIARLGLDRGTEFMMVFRITSAAAVLGYALSYVPDSIWKGLSWGTTMKFIFDGVVYGLVTAATFGWLWPDAA
jgi:hypothetical protein